MLGDLLADGVDGFHRATYGANGYGLDLAAQVLKPLGMTASGTTNYLYNRCPECFAVDTATGTRVNQDGAVPKTAAPVDPNLPAEDPMGGVWSDATDMVRYLHYSMGRKVGNPALRAAQPLLVGGKLRLIGQEDASERERVGLGWQIVTQDDPRDDKSISCAHEGGTINGFTSEMVFRKNIAVQGVVVMLNFDSQSQAAYADQSPHTTAFRI